MRIYLILVLSLSLQAISVAEPGRVLKEITVSGKGYERGFQHGEQLKKDIAEIIANLNAARVGVCVNTLMQLKASSSGLPVAFVVRELIRRTDSEDILEFIAEIVASARTVECKSPCETFGEGLQERPSRCRRAGRRGSDCPYRGRLVSRTLGCD